jgi:hypothetical protein
MTQATKKAPVVSPTKALEKLTTTSIRIYALFLLTLTASLVYIAPMPSQSTQETR